MRFFLIWILISFSLFSEKETKCIDYSIHTDTENQKLKLFCFTEDKEVLLFKLKFLQEEKLRENLKDSKFFFIKENQEKMFIITVIK